MRLVWGWACFPQGYSPSPIFFLLYFEECVFRTSFAATVPQFPLGIEAVSELSAEE